METRENGRDPYNLPKVTHNITFLHSTSLNFTSMLPTLLHPDSLNGLSTASLPPWGQSTPLCPSTFSPFHCSNPMFAAGKALIFALMADPVRGTAKPAHLCHPKSCSCAGTLHATQADLLSHWHIFPLLSKALECVHCTFIAGSSNGAGFDIHLAFFTFVGNLWVRYWQFVT